MTHKKPIYQNKHYHLQQAKTLSKKKSENNHNWPNPVLSKSLIPVLLSRKHFNCSIDISDPSKAFKCCVLIPFGTIIDTSSNRFIKLFASSKETAQKDREKMSKQYNSALHPNGVGSGWGSCGCSLIFFWTRF